MDAWGADLTGEQRAELKEKYKLTDEQVETLDAMAHYERLAAELGDTSIDMENDIKKLNEELDKMSEENRQQVLDELKAEDEANANSANANPAANTNTDGNANPEGNANANPAAQPTANPNEANNAIPLPRRFVGADGRIYNENAVPSAPVRFKVSAQEQTNWNSTLDSYEAGTLPQRGMNTVLDRTPEVLQRCGANNLPIRISKSVLDKITKEKHGVSVKELRGLLTNIDNPIAVFRSRTNPNSLVVLTEIKDSANGNNSIVALQLDVSDGRGGYEVNAVASIYGRPATQIESFMRDGLALYVNQKKSRDYHRSNRLQLPAEATKRGNPSLLTEEDFANSALGEVEGQGGNSGNIRFSAREENSHGDTEAQREAAEIIRKAKENGTWMKAPNGKPTKLSEKQWVQVRTKAFIFPPKKKPAMPKNDIADF